MHDIPRAGPNFRGKRVKAPAAGYPDGMKLLRSAAAIAIAKRVYEEARKPHNQAKIRSVVNQARSRRKPPPGR